MGRGEFTNDPHNVIGIRASSGACGCCCCSFCLLPFDSRNRNECVPQAKRKFLAAELKREYSGRLMEPIRGEIVGIVVLMFQF